VRDKRFVAVHRGGPFNRRGIVRSESRESGVQINRGGKTMAEKTITAIAGRQLGAGSGNKDNKREKL